MVVQIILQLRAGPQVRGQPGNCPFTNFQNYVWLLGTMTSYNPRPPSSNVLAGCGPGCKDGRNN